MLALPKPIVDRSFVHAHLDDPHLRLIDCRFRLSDPQEGQQMYARAHLPGAIFLDLERDLSGPKGPSRGRHPMPDASQLARTLGQLGVSNEDAIVVYDQGAGEFAARAWWLLRYLGHDEVAVLEQGFGGWQQSGLPVEADPVQRPAAHFKLQQRPEMAVAAEQLLAPRPGRVLLDARSNERYTGAHEPLDAEGGHIPGALNRFWQNYVSPSGIWQSPEQLREAFADLKGAQEVVAYCGSGVTACADLLALWRAGYKDAKLYPGSWSEWITDPKRPRATGH